MIELSKEDEAWMRTPVRFEESTELSYPPAALLKRRAACLLGRLAAVTGVQVGVLGRARSYYEKKVENDREHAAAAGRDRLPSDAIRAFAAYQPEVYAKRRAEFFQSRPLSHTIQGQAIPLVATILGQENRARSVLNVGVRFGYIDAVLAERHPAVRFSGIDFGDVTTPNHGHVRPNLQFFSGYALDAIEGGELPCDVVLFSSTAALISNAELRRYFRAIAARGRYLILNEPLFHALDGRVIDPGRLPLGKSIPVFDRCLAHNYKAMATEAGFQVRHYRVLRWPHRSRDPDLHLVHLIAERVA